MARFPSPEDLLTAILRRFGLKASSRQRRLGQKRLPNKKRFTGYELEQDGHIERWKQLLREIFNALELDESACSQAFGEINDIVGFSKAVELKTRTANASPQQVLWYALAYLYVPGLARIVAFWHLAKIKPGLPPADIGMPGDDFWYLPTINTDNGGIELPIPKVLKSLQKLFNVSAVEKLIDEIGREELHEDALHEDANLREAAGRTLRNWKAGTSIPKNAAAINKIFMPTVTLPGKGKEDRDQVHVHRLLLVARLAQSGYQDLVEFLCPDLPPEGESDPLDNKVLQLIALFRRVYNLKIKASNQSRDYVKQNEWFENQLSPWERQELLLSIEPSIHDDVKFTAKRVAERLSRHFSTIEPRQDLEDLVIMPEMSQEHIEILRVSQDLYLQKELEEKKQLKRLKEQLQIKDPYQTLQNENNYWVLVLLVQSYWEANKRREMKICEMAMERLKEISNSAFEQGNAIAQALDFLFARGIRLSPKERRQVQTLLGEAQKNLEAWELFKPAFLRFSAKHALCENRWKDANKDYKAAMVASEERSFGELRGVIAMEGFAVALALETLNLQNHEVYYRNLLKFMGFPNDYFPYGHPSFKDAALECDKFFWSRLYRPYADVVPFEIILKVDSDRYVKESFVLIQKEDWTGLSDWLKKNRRVLGNSDLKDVCRSSLMMLWFNFNNGFSVLNHISSKDFDHIIKNLIPDSGGDFRWDSIKGLWLKNDNNYNKKAADVVKNWKENFEAAIRLLLKEWPDQPKIADFIGRTPLMMAVWQDNVELTSLLLPHSAINAQDYRGWTALHFAVLGRSSDCLALVLAANGLDDLKITTKVSFDEKNTVLHAAVRCAWLSGVRLIVKAFPELIIQKNGYGESPLDMALDILMHYEKWREFKGKVKAPIEDKGEIEKIVDLLRTEAGYLKVH